MKFTEMIYILDDDAGMRKSIECLLEANGLAYSSLESTAEFLSLCRLDCPSCLILDAHLPSTCRIEVLRQIKSRTELAMPVIILTETGRVTTAVECIKLGANDVLEKPVNPDQLLATARELLSLDIAHRERAAVHRELRQRVDRLTQREREILRLLCEGKSTKQMAANLSISAKTVSIHRWHLMKKMQAGSATEAVRLAFDADAA